MSAVTQLRRDLLAEWRARARCTGLAWLMDPPRPSLDERRLEDLEQAEYRQLERHAKAVCSSCPVYWPCRTWVMGLPAPDDPGGVIGGLTAAERHGVRTRRGIVGGQGQ